LGLHIVQPINRSDNRWALKLDEAINEKLSTAGCFYNLQQKS